TASTGWALTASRSCTSAGSPPADRAAAATRSRAAGSCWARSLVTAPTIAVLPPGPCAGWGGRGTRRPRCRPRPGRLRAGARPAGVGAGAGPGLPRPPLGELGRRTAAASRVRAGGAGPHGGVAALEPPGVLEGHADVDGEVTAAGALDVGGAPVRPTPHVGVLV